jgi:outer membrane receptor protein involved in Fe transport
VKTKTKPPVAARRAPAFAKKPAVVATGIALSLMVGPMAYAQQASDTVEKIEVTGSRIPPKNLDSAGSPVSVVSAEDIKMEGVRTIESLLNTLPQVVADQGANLANGASGTACINLRGLGCNRTLVLMNGKRLPPGAPNFYPADTNEIPPQLISRVEILTGGAGAVYGSDAVAGVINFIMNDKFQGVQIDYNNSFFNHHQQDTGGVGDLISAKVAAATASSFEYQRPGDVSADGKTNDISMIMGSNFADGKGNATLFFRYAHTDGILGAARDFSDCTLSSSAAGFSCSGSGTAYPGRFVVSKGNGPVPGSYTVADAAGNVRPYTAGDSFNFGSYNYFQRPDERYQFNAFAHYDLTPTMQTYSQFGFMDDHTVAQIAPAGSFGDIIFPIHYENPFLSAAWKTTLGLTGPGTTSNIEIFRRDVEGGARETDIRNTSFRGVVGLKGDINKTWSFDAFLQWGQVVNQQEIFNYFDKTKLTNALDVVTGPNGQPQCRSLATNPTCVPYNIWSLGGVTQAALNYMYAPGMQRGNTTQTVDGGTVTGDLGDYGVRSPWAKDGVQVLGGLEYRKESLSLFTDAELTNFGLDGTGGPTLGVAGGQNFKEGFAEVNAPLIQDRPWAKLLNIEGSWRHSEISTGKSDDSYGTQVSWAPNDWGKLRGSYQRAVRAPNIIELFTPQGLNLFAMSSDPCAGAAPTATAAQCARSGVTAAQYGNILVNPTVQYNTISGGNPNLAPELADTYTGGVILTPAKNLVLSADYFNIRVQNEIGTVPGGLAVTQCVETGNPAYCGLITRDQFGSLWQLPTGHVLGTNVNIAQAKTVGWDFSGTYSYRLPSWGSLRAEFIGTALEKAVTTPLPGQPSYNCAGLAGPNCANTWSNPLPKWKHRASMDWVTPWNVNLRVQWRHIGPVDNEGTSSSPSLNNPGLAPVDAHLESRDYIDLAGSWAINKMFTVRAGVNNVFDKDPPLQGSAIAGAPFGNNNTYPQTYDALGRYCFINLTAKF